MHDYAKMDGPNLSTSKDTENFEIVDEDSQDDQEEDEDANYDLIPFHQKQNISKSTWKKLYLTKKSLRSA